MSEVTVDPTTNDDSRSGERSAVLQAHELCAAYGRVPVLHDLEIEVRPGEVLGLFGANGAGKTSTLLTLSGVLPPRSGEVRMFGAATRTSLFKRARRGMGFITEEKSIFRSLTTADNIRVGGVAAADVLSLFPELEPRMSVRAGLLSGGEQQMLALGRALARRPQILLADELSLGLAPLVVRRLLDAVRAAATDHGTAVILVEQHVREALRIVDRGLVMRRGRIELSGNSAELRDRLGEIEETYLSLVSSAVDEAGRTP